LFVALQEDKSSEFVSAGPFVFCLPRIDGSCIICPREHDMNSIEDRQKGFESKFALDEELRFKANARRNKLLGLWAAEKLGKTGEAADEYAKSVVMADFEEAGDDDVFRKIRKDFDAGSVEQSDHQIRRTMDELMAVAAEQIQNG
jgi:hypothetical protein